MGDVLPFANITYETHCFPGPLRNSCHITDSEESKRTAIAVIRLVVSVLSITGCLSIIISAVAKKQVKSPKVFPIFMISIADGLLAVTWVVGSLIWLVGISSVEHREWCFLPALLTIMLVCVSSNLTLIYAIGAYTSLKRKNLNVILSNNLDSSRGWKLSKTAALYLYAWLAPIATVLIGFGINEGIFSLVDRARKCSCWCIPYFGNVMPLVFQGDNATADYVYDFRNLVITFGFTVGIQYLVVFFLLVFFYWKILSWIRQMRKQHSERNINSSSYTGARTSYGSINVLLLKGQSQARKRIVYFISIFIITGLSNAVLSFLFVIHELGEVRIGPRVLEEHIDPLAPWLMVLYVLQSLTAPMQGFLNALVYGWTREEFFEAITRKKITSEVSRTRFENSISKASDSVFKSEEINESESFDAARNQIFERSSERSSLIKNI